MALFNTLPGNVSGRSKIGALVSAFLIPLSAFSALDEITVTAQKKNRAENLQDVPAAITALSGDQLDAKFYQKLDDLSYTVPNVQLEAVGTFPGVQNFSIRGQGINSSIPSVDPTVGLFVDGVYIGTSFGTVIDNWDLESVEVLRGPQGVLFGRNVTGGAVTLRTARPDPSGDAGFKARVLATSEGRRNIATAIEAPLIQDELGAKLVIYHDDDDGYFENQNQDAPFAAPFTPVTYYLNSATTGRDIGQLETTVIRPSFVWEPADNLQLTLIAEVGETEGDGAAWTNVDAQRAGAQEDFTTTSDEVGLTDMEWNQVTFEVNWDVGGGTLTNILGWREADVASFTDVDGSFAPIFSGGGNTDQDQFSNELRWAGNFSDRWESTIGAYYLKQDIAYREERWLQFDGVAPIIPATALQLGGDLEADTFGLFWNNDYALNERLTLTTGIRYSDEQKDANILGAGCVDVDGANVNNSFEFSLGGTGLPCLEVPLSGDYDFWTPKVGASWKYDENTQIYAFWTKGYRAGGFNFRNARPDVIPPGPTQEEEQNSIEVGVKTELFDSKLRINAAYFHNEIDDIQRELNLPDPLVVVLQGTINAGDVEINGVEVEFQAIPQDNLTIYGSVGYLDGEYKSVNPAFAGFLGSDLPRLAPWSASLGGSYDIPLESNGYLTIRGDWGFRDENPYDDANLNIFDQQRRYSASIQWTSSDENLQVSLFGKNLSDEANWGNLTSIAGLYTAGPMQKGREYGIELQYQL
ncbi:MAG: TonB-dependent receptor [Pseudomonadota bacterium]|nr:TonB-dependent receptor [Pseudomonadota bacterium]